MIWLASFPRSGNKLVQHVLHYVYGHKVRTVYDVPEVKEEIAQKWDGDRKFGGFVKTHELPSTDALSVYVVRDPRDVFCSYASYLISTGETPREMSFREAVLYVIESNHYGGWSKNTLEWSKKATVTLRYEDCLSDPVAQIGSACRSLAINDAVKGTQPDFYELQKSCSYYYQKGISGRWRSDLDLDLAELIQKQNSEMMSIFGYRQA